jgi:tRNA dimethylallyltransferase
LYNFNANTMINPQYNLIVVLGPTATGKTRFASMLASQIGGEIISADSRQVYKRMNLGTGKDYQDYMVNGVPMPCHLIDICEPGTKYNVFEFQKDFFKVFEAVNSRKMIPVLCGGTGMYIEAVSKGYQLISVPVNQELRDSLSNKTLEELENILATYRKLHNKTDTDTVKRAIRAIEIEEYYKNNASREIKLPRVRPIYLGVSVDREIRRERITKRLYARLEAGMVQEVELLLEEGISPEDLIYYGLEYKYITLYLTGKLSYETMVNQLNIAIHQFAKRQMTWFRKMERDGVKINWIDGQIPGDEKIEQALRILELDH